MEIISKLPLLSIVALLSLAIGILAYFVNSRLAFAQVINARKANVRVHSLPAFHGWFGFWISAVPPILFLAIAGMLRPTILNLYINSILPQSVKSLEGFERDIYILDAQKLAFGGDASQSGPEISAIAQKLAVANGSYLLIIAIIAIALAAIGFLIGKGKVSADFRARNIVENLVKAVMIIAASLAILTTFGIVLSLIFETIKFFGAYSPIDFLFGTQWSPQVAIRADQVGQSGAFGAVPLFLGTFMIMLIAMLVAVPIGLGSAIYLSEYATTKARAIVKPALELLAGIPTVVYGFFALLTVAPLVRDLGTKLGLETSSQSALAAGVVMGIMIIPFISSLSDDVINAVPQNLRDGSYAMGATKSETVSRVVLPAALPGIIGSILLAVSRALGETMIVAMAAGQNANLSVNPLDIMTTVTVQIVMLLTGDQEYDSPKTHVAFALGFVLFIITLILNIIALRVVQKYREKYD